MAANSRQTEERCNFILARIRSGLSRAEIVRQFKEVYKTGRSQSNEWYNRAADSLIVNDPLQTKRLRASIVEMYHAQIAGCQSDLATIVQEIKRVDDWREQRNLIQERLLTEKDIVERHRLQAEIETIPKLNPLTKSNLIEAKCRVRDRIIKLFGELARINGLYVEQMPWIRAVQVLVDNNLLPSNTAESILDTIQNINTQIESIEIDAED
jgi:hypothetical protein